MKGIPWLCATLVALAPHPAHADRGTWDSGAVHIDLRVAGGSGRVVPAGDDVALSFVVDADAYVAVYAIDTIGAVRLLYPRFWECDGWVAGGTPVRLRACDLASQSGLGAGAGIVYVQAVASPVPFAWRRAGLRAVGGQGGWWSQGQPLRVQGDPLLAFNDMNRLLFGCWDEAVFAADIAWFYAGHACEHPVYLCGVCAGRHRGYHDPWTRVGADLVCDLQRGRGFCRPVYRPLYVVRDDRRDLRHAAAESAGNRSPLPADSGVRRRAVEVAVDHRIEAAHGRRTMQRAGRIDGGIP